MAYSTIENKTTEQLHDELMNVYNNYPEYQDFYNMILLFASDSFYNLHLVAKEYKRQIDNLL